MNKLLLFSLGTLMMASCAVGPDYVRPQTKIDNLNGYMQVAENGTDMSTVSHWWERIDDPLLTSYVDMLLAENLDLEQVAQRVIQAGEQVNVERGSFFPAVGTDTSAGRNFSSNNSGLGALGRRIYTTSYNAELNTSWQIDLFGKISRSMESAQANYEATQFDKQALIHSLIAELLQRRIAISVYKKRLELAQRNADNRRDTYDLVKNRYDLGVSGSNAADVYLAEENYTSIQSDVHEFERLLTNEIYTLDVLLGQVPGTTDPLASNFPVLPPPLDVPVCLPADLLDRRPDLLASELRLAAATANIGIAVADLYPSLNLVGDIGFSGSQVSNLFSANQLAGSILGNITSRLFEGGRLRANIRLQESAAKEQSAVYAGEVLEAVREVESALKTEKELSLQLENINKSVNSLRQAEEISKDRYLRGILTLRDYLDTQQRRYGVEQSLLGLQQEKWNTRIALYLALGGDWFGKQDDQACGAERRRQ